MSVLRRLVGNARGIAIVEFAIVATPLFIVLLSLVDLGFRQYMQTQLEGTLEQASRKVTIGGVTPATIQTFVTNRMRLILPGTTVTVVPKAYDDFDDVGKPEPITTDTAPLGIYNTGDCFLDLNVNGRWDADSSASGNGSGDDVIYYTATATFPALLPLTRWLGFGSNRVVVSTIAVRNQPFAAQAQPTTVCT